MIFHHGLCIVGMLLPVYENVGGNFAMKALFFAEVSNPVMHYRHLTRFSGRRYTLLYELFEISFFVIYIYARLIAVVPTAIRNVMCPMTHLLFKIA